MISTGGNSSKEFYKLSLLKIWGGRGVPEIVILYAYKNGAISAIMDAEIVRVTAIC